MRELSIRERAIMACDRDLSCAVDSSPRRSPRRGLAAIPRGRRVVFWFRNLAVPFWRRAIDLISLSLARNEISFNEIVR
jgi:hypothetical protein